MRSQNKSRSRNKNHNNNRRSNPTNVVNRVFDSSGPEGKVRGTPQQIIDKYQGLAGDAMLSGDRVNAENFLQHSEHYSRLLTEAQREINERREAQDAQRQQNQQNQNNNNNNNNQQQNQNQNNQQKPAVVEGDAQPDIAGNAADLFPAQAGQSNLVETPESKGAPAVEKKPARKKPAKKVEADKSVAEESDVPAAPKTDKAAEPDAPVAEKTVEPVAKPETAAE
jgi:hypothetical protein